MTARIIGALLIAGVSLSVGGSLIHIWQKRAAQLSSFCRLLSALEDGIGKMGLPIQSIVASFSDEVLEAADFLPTARRLGESDRPVNALGQAFSVCHPYLAIDEEERVLLEQFFCVLGTEDRAREAQRCAYVRSRLERLHGEAVSALPAQCRIAKTLAGAVGCAAALLLL